MSVPQVSILVPMRNAAAYVESAVQSILTQSDVKLEVIVIDNGSTDRSVDVVKAINDPRVRLIHCQQPGISATLNAGIEAATALLIARCDADDLFTPDRLARQVSWLNAHPDYAMICGSFITITPSGKPAGQPRFSQVAEEITQELLAGETRTHLCTFLIRTEALRKIGGCREWFNTAEDIDLQLRLAEVGKVYYEPACAYQYRVHDESITHQQPNAQRIFYAECAKQFLHDRRTTGADALQRGTPPPIPAADQADRQSSSAHLQKLLVGTAWDQHARGQKRDAIFTGLRACFMRPLNVPAWKSLLMLMLKRVPSPK